MRRMVPSAGFATHNGWRASGVGEGVTGFVACAVLANTGEVIVISGAGAGLLSTLQEEVITRLKKARKNKRICFMIVFGQQNNIDCVLDACS